MPSDRVAGGRTADPTRFRRSGRTSEVGRIGDQDGEQAGQEVGHPAAGAAGVHKVLRKPDPAVDVDQRVDELDERDSLLDLVIQPGDLRRQPQRLDRVGDHLAGLDPHPGVLIDRLLQRPDRGLLISLELLEPDVRVQRPADRDRDLLANISASS